MPTYAIHAARTHLSKLVARAQATIEDLTLLSNEKGFDAYGVKRLW